MFIKILNKNYNVIKIKKKKKKKKKKKLLISNN